jgi:hypothetical protein
MKSAHKGFAQLGQHLLGLSHQAVLLGLEMHEQKHGHVIKDGRNQSDRMISK